MSNNKNRRLVSGDRVLCKCSMLLPSLNPFAGIKISRSGYMVLNVRGGSLYLAQQLNEQSVASIFPPDKTSLIKQLTLYPDNGSAILLGDMNVRYLKMTDGLKYVGLVLRFVNISEEQLDILIGLPDYFPLVSGDEESVIAGIKL